MQNEIDLFHVIPEAKAIVRSRGGLYKQVEVFRRGRDVYIKVGGGFAKCHAAGGTSVPSLHVDALQGDGIVTEHGRGPKWQEAA